MKKNMMKKALAVLVILAMMIPFMPVVAGADTVAPVKWDESVDAVAGLAYLNENCLQEDEVTYILDDATDLAYFMACGRGATAEKFSGKTVKLGANIVWNNGNPVDGFTPRDGAENVYIWESYSTLANSQYDFQGTFDGNGKTISGLYILNNKYAGFLGRIRGAQVKDLTIANSAITIESTSTAGGDAIGMAVGTFYGNVVIANITVKNCHINSAIAYTGIGGVVGRAGFSSATLDMDNCIFDADSSITALEKIGGVYGSAYTATGANSQLVENCFNYSQNITATKDGATYVNPIVGIGKQANGTYTNCAAFTKITVGGETKTVNAYQNGYWNSVTEFDLEAPVTGVMSMEVEGVQTKKADTTFDARFVASIDLGEVTTTNTLIGFEFALVSEMAAETPVVQHKGCETVYKSITTTFGGEDLTAEGFGADYLATLVITGIPATGTQSILIRSWYTVDGGAAQYGNYALVTFVNGQILDAQYVTEYVAE